MMRRAIAIVVCLAQSASAIVIHPPHNGLKMDSPAFGPDIITDTFVDTASTALTSHTSDSGHTWAAHSSSAGSAIVVSPDRIQANSGTVLNYSSTQPVSMDYDIITRMFCQSTTYQGAGSGAMARMQIGSTDLYYWRYSSALNWSIAEAVAGAGALIGNAYPDTLTASQTYTVRFQVRGKTLKLFVDGVLRCVAIGSVAHPAGRPGIRGRTQTGALYWEDFRVKSK